MRYIFFLFLNLISPFAWCADILTLKDLDGKTAVYQGDEYETYTILLEQWETRSSDGLPALRSSREVSLSKNGILKDANLGSGDIIYVDGNTLRSIVDTPVISRDISDKNKLPAKSSIKGWDLYSWRLFNGELRFSLLKGTNTKKPRSKIINHAGTISTTTDLKDRISELAIGQNVVWHHIGQAAPTTSELETVSGLIRLAKLKYIPGVEVDDMHPREKSFKGMELYSWNSEDGVLRFSLLEGTNEDKSLEDILAPSNVVGDVTALREHIKTLATGETVSWTHLDAYNRLPTVSEIDAVKELARGRGISVRVPTR